MAEVSLVHLVWAPLGTAPVERFAASYLRHPAETDHEVVAVYKEFRDPAALEEARRILAPLGPREIHMPRRKLDLAAYRALADELDTPFLFYCNSNSEALAGGWLRSMLRCLREPGVGMVGATGSFESFLSAAPRPLKPLRRLTFAPFPNPHLRSNAFMLDRSLAARLDWPEVRRKRAAWALESGRRGLTRQVAAAGLETLVAGRDGQGYPPERWPESRTFRSGRQENLLVADNRTRDYERADAATRRRLAELAWGSVPREQQPERPATDRRP